MTATTKMSINELRDIARSLGITTGLYGTSKVAMVLKIQDAQRTASPSQFAVRKYLTEQPLILSGKLRLVKSQDEGTLKVGPF
jgi:hypothetical protein